MEGDLEVRLDIADGVVVAAEVTAPLYRGFEQILADRPPLDALAIAPRICGICSVSQSMAAAAALRAAAGIEPARNGVLAANLAHAAENVADHLTHFYLFFMPDFARSAYAARPWAARAAVRFAAMTGSAAAEMLPARARLLEIMGLLAGKWPHSLAFQPGGTTRAIDLGERIRLLAIIADAQAFLERVVFGDRLDSVLALRDAAGLDAWREGREGDFATFLQIADDLDLARLGRGQAGLMSFGAYHAPDGPLFAAGRLDPATLTTTALDPGAITEDVRHAWMQDTAPLPLLAETVPDADKPGAYSWCKAPRIAGRPAEVGALARQAVDGQPLVRDLLAREGATVRTRVIARLIETARLLPAMRAWAQALRPGEPFLAGGSAGFDQGIGVGLVEAARGSLGHWLDCADGRIRRYQIIAPTTWNFSPRDAAGVPGPLEAALAGTEVGALGGQAPAIQHVVRSYDPCMVCTAH